MAPSIRYINATAPFWDFIANLENSDNQGNQHPFFAGPSGNEGSGHRARHQHPWGPWGPWGGWNHGWQQDQQTPNQEAAKEETSGKEAEKEDEAMKDNSAGEEAGNQTEENPDKPSEGGRRRHCGGRRARGSCPGGPHGFGHHGPRIPHGHHGPHGPHGPFRYGRNAAFPFRPNPAFEFLSGMFQDSSNAENETQDFKPDVDVFDTESAFVIHASLPGAKKDDVAVNWDAEKSELGIAGVVHRPGDEELLKNLALDERRVGAFERRVRLGTRANPAQVDVDGISAKLDNGILIIEVPKIGGDDFVEVKKVDVE